MAAGGPREAGVADLVEESRRQGALGRPHAGRRRAETRGVAGPGAVDVGGDPRAPARVFRRRRQRAFRPRLARRLEVEQQRRQRMAGRGAGKFDLAAFGQRAVTRDQPVQHVADLGQQLRAVLEVEGVALGHQSRHQMAFAAQAFAGPHEHEPDGEVDVEAAGEVAHGVGVLRPDEGEQVAQAAIRGERFEHGRRVAAEGHVEQPVLLFRRQQVGVGVGDDAQQRIAPLPAAELVAVILDLVEQHRHEIDRAPHAGMAFEVAGHVGVVLERVQQHPGQHEIAAFRVPVVRLVHVPEEGEISHRATGVAPWPSISGVTSVMPLGVTKKRRRSSSASSPITMPSGMRQRLSMTQRRSRAWRPTSTPGRTTESSTVAQLCT